MQAQDLGFRPGMQLHLVCFGAAPESILASNLSQTFHSLSLSDALGTLDPFGSRAFSSSSSNSEGFADFSRMSKVTVTPISLQLLVQKGLGLAR